MNPLTWLFDTTGFVPRLKCGSGWTETLVFWNHLGNALVFAAYVAIPVVFLVTWNKLKAAAAPKVLKDYPRWTLLSFAAFIFTCGVGHFLDIIVFYYAPYRLTTAWRFVIGACSVWGLAGLVVGGRFSFYKLDEIVRDRESQVKAREEVLRQEEDRLRRAQAAADLAHAELNRVRHRINNEQHVRLLHDRIDAIVNPQPLTHDSDFSHGGVS